MFCDDLSKLLPGYQDIGYFQGSYTIHESSGESKIKDVTWENADFQVFSTTIAKDLTGFFQSAKAGEIFWFDCDGAFLLQGDDRKFLFLCELKSGFDSSDIYHACNQITSTYIKLSMILNLLPNYRKDDVVVKGFIVSRPASKDYLRDLHKQSMMGHKSKFTTDAEFCYDLCYNADHSYVMNLKKCHQLKDVPLGKETLSSQIEFHHIPVAEPSSNITIDVMNYTK